MTGHATHSNDFSRARTFLHEHPWVIFATVFLGFIVPGVTAVELSDMSDYAKRMIVAPYNCAFCTAYLLWLIMLKSAKSDVPRRKLSYAEWIACFGLSLAVPLFAHRLERREVAGLLKFVLAANALGMLFATISVAFG